MKRICALIAVLAAFSVFARLNHAATEHLTVDHVLTGYSKSARTLTLNYKLHVVNPGNTSFCNLSLSMVPLPHLVSRGTTVSIGYLGPHETTDVSLRVVTPPLLDPRMFSRNQFFWTGNYQDADGKQVELPVKSRPAVQNS